MTSRAFPCTYMPRYLAKVPSLRRLRRRRSTAQIIHAAGTARIHIDIDIDNQLYPLVSSIDKLTATLSRSAIPSIQAPHLTSPHSAVSGTSSTPALSTSSNTPPFPLRIMNFPLAVQLLIPCILVVLYRHYTSPLRKIPAAHPLAPFTSLWIASVRWRSRENATIAQAHARLGPVVCLGPREVSVNCVRGGVRTVYAGGFEKSDERGEGNWYAFFANYGG